MVYMQVAVTVAVLVNNCYLWYMRFIYNITRNYFHVGIHSAEIEVYYDNDKRSKVKGN